VAFDLSRLADVRVPTYGVVLTYKDYEALPNDGRRTRR
jgi:hypothetical protein